MRALGEHTHSQTVVGHEHGPDGAAAGPALPAHLPACWRPHGQQAAAFKCCVCQAATAQVRVQECLPDTAEQHSIHHRPRQATAHRHCRDAEVQPLGMLPPPVRGPLHLASRLMVLQKGCHLKTRL